ncbi:hypothetical protein B7G54_33270 [Burkholderia puraquae]|uniref:Uncharacterized protein n=1 Tax=Burkholderia puraquae TaxID=1904757 RepID=A0A1X1P775_9BURK|nr:hypothetical protein B7G54_33270 [Burkholderia puraquae]
MHAWQWVAHKRTLLAANAMAAPAIDLLGAAAGRTCARFRTMSRCRSAVEPDVRGRLHLLTRARAGRPG